MAKRKTARTARARRDAASRRELKKHAEAQIDAFLRKVGVKDPAEITDHGVRQLSYGSVSGFCYVDYEDGEVMIHAAADIMALPSDRELVVPLMRELLELNAGLNGATRLAIAYGRVYAAGSQRVESMKDEDYARYIEDIVELADLSATKLLKKYAATTRKRPGRRSSTR